MMVLNQTACKPSGVPHAHLHHPPCPPASGPRKGKDNQAKSLIYHLRENGESRVISTIVEPVEPNGLAGFSLYSTACRDVGGVDDMSVRDRYSFPQRQTEIPTDLFSEVVGIVILCVFVVDLDLIVEQDDLVHEGVDQQS